MVQELQVDRLADEVVRAGAHRRNGAVQGAESGHHEHLHIRVVLAKPRAQREPALFAQHHVAEHEAIVVLLQESPRLGDARCAIPLQAAPRELLGKKLSQVVVVVDEKDPRGHKFELPCEGRDRHTLRPNRI